jgi:hypothetical protein
MINRSAQEIYDVLRDISLDKLADIDLIDAVLYPRQGMKEFRENVVYWELDDGKPGNQSLGQFQMVQNLIDRALHGMGIWPVILPTRLKKSFSCFEQDHRASGWKSAEHEPALATLGMGRNC